MKPYTFTTSAKDARDRIVDNRAAFRAAFRKASLHHLPGVVRRKLIIERFHITKA